MNIQEYADRDMLAIDVANALAGELEAALLLRQFFILLARRGLEVVGALHVLAAESFHAAHTGDRRLIKRVSGRHFLNSLLHVGAHGVEHRLHHLA